MADPIQTNASDQMTTDAPLPAQTTLTAAQLDPPSSISTAVQSSLPSSASTMSTKVQTDSDGHFPFLSLPLEIRSMVYERHLATPGDLCLFKPWSISSGVHTHIDDNPIVGVNLLCCCKQIYAEAIQYVWRDRTCVLGRLPDIWDYYNDDWGRGPAFDSSSFLKILKTGTLARIERLQIAVPIVYMSDSADHCVSLGHLSCMKSLKKVDICLCFYDPEWQKTPNILHLTLFTGQLVQMLGQIPKHIDIHWMEVHTSDYGKEEFKRNNQAADVVRDLAKELEPIRGFMCKDKPTEEVPPQ